MPRPSVMGILNVTPDSFSDGGLYLKPEQAAAHAIGMVEEGAAIIDIGGESTRPGSQAVAASVQIERVVPVIEAIRAHSSIPLSIDTRQAAVAEAALDAGCNWINDISAGDFDPELPALVAQRQVPYIIMHMRGEPETMQNQTDYDDVSAEVRDYLIQKVEWLSSLGISDLIVDPGLGFAKTAEQNLVLLQNLRQFKEIQRPLLIGASRKSFIQKYLASDSSNVLEGSLAIAAHAFTMGCDLIRVHDVGPTVRLYRLLEQLQSADGDSS